VKNWFRIQKLPALQEGQIQTLTAALKQLAEQIQK